jgi:hypothetical protein
MGHSPISNAQCPIPNAQSPKEIYGIFTASLLLLYSFYLRKKSHMLVMAIHADVTYPL